LAPAQPAAEVVQKLLGEVRGLKVEIRRLQAELEDANQKVGRPDPRLKAQEAEISRLRSELAAAREQRDVVTEGLRRAAERLRTVLPPGQ